MAFELAAVQAVSFDSVEQVLTHVEQEQKNVARIPIVDLVEKGAFFFSDKYFGNADLKLTMNEPALNDLFRWLDFYSPSFLERLEKTDLASEVLTDLVRSQAGKNKLKNAEFVFDDSTKTVIGVVSDTYVGYSNKKFLDDICDCLSSKKKQKSVFSELTDFEFETSYSINTHLHLRLLHKKMTGVIRGKGGIAEDVSKLGLQLSNAMSGGKALKMDYFVHRLVCANGLILPVGGAQARLIHSGKEENFQKRLSTKMNEVIDSLATSKKMIESLGAVNFNADKIAHYPEIQKLFEIIPHKNLAQSAKNQFSEEIRFNLENLKKDKLKYEHQIKVETIKQIPYLIGGEHSDRVFKSYFRENASAFDFINVLTEEAHKHLPKERLHIEKEAGNLADFVVKNKKMFG
jgi:hypothetical protein